MRPRLLLVVEDDSRARSILHRVFTLRGWVVRSAGTVSAALQQMDPPPDCVIIDLMLPDGQGESVINEARNLGLTSRFVVTTGCADDARVRRLGLLEPDAVLIKPYDVNEICRACRD